jgi:predicted Zn-dependent peptidase
MPKRARSIATLSLVLTSLAAVPLFGARARADVKPATALPAAPSLAVEKTTLANGLEVILHEDHRTPIVSVNLWYHVGSKDEPAGRSGFAHLFEHVMFQGSKHVPEDMYFAFLERAGATGINGTTADDRTNYFETVPSNQLELALWLESDRMGFLLDHVDDADFKGQVKVVKRERGQHYESARYGMVGQFLREAMYPATHPYHHQTIGTTEDLDHATLDDVRAFFRSWYVPNNATLVLSGDIDKTKAKALVEKYFGPIPRGNVPQHATATPVVLSGETRLDIAAGVALPRVYVEWPTPAFFAPGDAELDILAHALASGRASRLHKRLVYADKVATDVGASQSSLQLGSTFSITATVAPGHTPQEVLAAIDDELAKVRADGVRDDEVVGAKTAILSNALFGIESDSERADSFNTFNFYTGDPAYLAKDVARHDVSAAAVRDAARTYVPADKRVVAIVTPTEGAPISGVLKGRTP